MSETEGLEVVLSCLAEDFGEAERQAAEAMREAKLTGDRLDQLVAKVEELKREMPAAVPSGPVVSAPGPRPAGAKEAGPLWDSTAAHTEAEQRLRQRGVDLRKVSLDDLLDKEEAERIERRFRGGFSIQANLDRYDVAVAVVAGLVAALADFLVVKIPKDMVYLGRMRQRGSRLTKWLQSMSVPHDNWLARHFKTSFDSVKEVADGVSGFGPRSHRLQTFGHDPFVGLVIGTIDVMRGGLTAISREGEPKWRTGTGAAHYNPFTALVWEVMHLWGDVFTKMGLPVPGWSLLHFFQVGSFGERKRTVAELARFMYLKGYDCRHFLTMSTSVAAAEVVLRGYFWVRRKLDREYDGEMAHEGDLVAAKRTGDYPHFQAMALAAHTVASAANAGKVVVYGGNPLAVNYAQWLRFLQAAFTWMSTKLRPPSEVIAGYGRANWIELDTGWPRLEVSEAAFPTLAPS